MTQSLIEEPCVGCNQRWARRKLVQLGAETVCGGCMAALSPGWTWTVGGAMSVLVCDDCAVRCSKCRPVDTRLQWGDHHRQPSYFRKLAAEGKLASAISGGAESIDSPRSERRRAQRAAKRRQQAETTRAVRWCECGCGERIPPEVDPRQKFIDARHKDRHLYAQSVRKAAA